MAIPYLVDVSKKSRGNQCFICHRMITQEQESQRHPSNGRYRHATCHPKEKKKPKIKEEIPQKIYRFKGGCGLVNKKSIEE